MNIIYFLLAFFATVFGSMAGLGGGVIIKPVLDMIGRDDLNTISLLSSATIFSMSVVSLIKQISSGFKFQGIYFFLSAGAIAGGILGKILFSLAVAGTDPGMVKGIQAGILICLLTISLLRHKLPDWEIESYSLSSVVGLFLGVSAAFLSIGGGPINVAVICIFLAVTIREAAVVSILIIFFSQGAKLLTIAATTGFSEFDDIYKLFYMIPGGIAGGLLGSTLNRKLSHAAIHNVYNIILIAIIAVNIYNLINAFAC